MGLTKSQYNFGKWTARTVETFVDVKNKNIKKQK
jgi:hypothetical protein